MEVNRFETHPSPADAWDLLSPGWSEARRQKLLKVSALRTRHLRLALQDVHDPHNVGACLRSADAFGVQNVDIINLVEKFPRPSSTSRGSRHWLDLHRFDNISAYIKGLRQRGYKIAAAYPTHEALPLEKLPVAQPLVIAFGNEQNGLHPDWEREIDFRFTIPMYGMVESFNISVSAALSLHSINLRCRNLLANEQYLLHEKDRQELLCRWACMQSDDPVGELERLRQALVT